MDRQLRAFLVLVQESTPASPLAPPASPHRQVEVIFLKDVQGDEVPPASHSRPLITLLALTVLGGIVRFLYLNHPTLWGDEARVYWRACGTYSDLIQILRSDGFAPLHYELNWLLLRILKPTPTTLRLLPALCGTLMIPAMYFLARQLLQRSASLVVAAFTAFSGFLIFYSRDAKMYSDAWLFIALNMGCLLWWFRTRSLTAWLCWIAAGLLACGTHATALAVLAFSPLLLVTQRKANWIQSLFLAFGLAIILSGPVGYYFKFNHWLENVDQRGWGATGIDWVEEFQNQTGPELVRYTATNYLMGWTWPDPRQEFAIPPWLIKWPKIAAETIGGFLMLSLLPWPLFLRPRRDIDPPPESSWRVFFWIIIWIVFPAYIFYCHSVHDFPSPVDWYHGAIGGLPDSWLTRLSGRPLIGWAIPLAVIAAVAPGFIFRPTRPAFLRGLQYFFAASAILLSCQLIYQICLKMSDAAILENQPWHSIWIPRYLGFIWPAIAVAVGALIMRLPTRALRAIAVVILLAINLSFGIGRIAGHTEPPVDQMAIDVVAANRPDAHTRAYTDIFTAGPGPAEGTLHSISGMYYLQLSANHQPMSPDRLRRSLSEYDFRNEYSDRSIASDAAKTSSVTQIIIWEEFTERPSTSEDTLLPHLPGWNLSSEKWFPLRSYWTWQDLSFFRRREYIRLSGPVAPAG